MQSDDMSEIEKICHLLKVTNSVRINFVPGPSQYLDKKSAKWNITTIDEFGMSVKLFFENPVYVARDELLDLIKVSYHNTEFYMDPENG